MDLRQKASKQKTMYLRVWELWEYCKVIIVTQSLGFKPIPCQTSCKCKGYCATGECFQ